MNGKISEHSVRPYEISDFADRHPGTKHILRFFTWAHLPEHLEEISKPFCQLALETTASVPDDPELTVALRKLLEAKDAAVRAALIED